jgi:hypothetical protein
MEENTRRPTTLTQSTTKKRRLQRRQGEHFQCQQQHQQLVRRQEENISQPGLEDLEKAGLTVHTETDPNTGAVTFSIQKLDSSQTPPAPQQAEIPSPKSKRDDAPCPSINDNTGGTGVGTLFLPQVYASLGHAAVAGDFDGDGVQELVISAPHFTRDVLIPSQGAVFITPSKALSSLSSSSNIQTLASQTLYGDPAEPQSRFGYSLAVVDLNQDGIDDLAVGAPGTGAKDLYYEGSVHVYFGVRGQGLGSSPDLKIGYDRTKRVIPAGLNVLSGIGRTLLGVDLTGSGHKDLVIGMPMATTINSSSTDPSTKYLLQAGRVLGFLGSSHHVGSKLDTDADWELQGDTKFGWFGASIAAVKASITGPNGVAASPQNVLVVGSPSFAPGADTAMIGNIQGYSSSDKVPQKLFTVHGMSSFQQFGSGLAALKEDGLLAVGSISESPDGSYWQAGALRVINVSLIKSGTNSKLSDLVPTAVVGSPLNGSQKTAQLSSALAASSGQSLWVSEPFVNGEDGRIIQWETSGTGGIKQCFRGEQNSRSRLGTRILATDLNGDGKEDLIVAASHDSRYAE